MIHYLYGPDATLLKIKSREEASKKVDVKDPFSFVVFSAIHDTVQDIVNECASPSFLGDLKVVIVEDCYFLSSSNDKVPPIDKQQNFQELLEYIDKPNYDNELYLLSVGKPNKKNEITNLLLKKGMVLEVLNLTEEEFVQKGMQLATINGCNIDRESILEILKRSNNDYTLFVNNLKKLFTYTKSVRLVDVENLVTKPLGDNVFALFESLIKEERPGKAISIYRDLTKLGYDSYKLLPVLASQFRFLAQVAYLLELGHSEKDISEELKCHPYRVTVSKRNLYNMDFKTIITIMSDLADMEKHLKYDLDNPNDVFEVFICNFKKNYIKRNY